MNKMMLSFFISLAIIANTVQGKSIHDKNIEAHSIQTNEVLPPDSISIKNIGEDKQVSLLPIGSVVNRINNFLDSPLVQAILTNETIKAVLLDKRVQGVLRNPIVQSVLRDPIVQNIISNPQTKGISILQTIFANLLRNPQYIPKGPIIASPRYPQGIAQPPPMMITVLRGLDGILSILQNYMATTNNRIHVRSR